MFAKYLVVFILIAILTSLGSGLYYMMKDKGQSKRTVRMLTVRIGLSVSLFVLLFVLWWAGLIQPHGLLPK